MSFFDEIRTIVEQYYPGMPAFGTGMYYEYIAKMQGELAEDITEKKYDVSIKTTCPTASTDLKDIFLSANLFREGWFNRLAGMELSKQALGDISICASNGFLMHEATHIEISDKTMFNDDFIESVEEIIRRMFNDSEFEIEKKEENLVRNLYNIIEDVRVNNYVYQNHRDIAFFLKITNSFLFNDAYVDRGWAKFQSNKTLKNAVMLLSNVASPFIKNHEWQSEFSDELDLLELAIGQDDVGEIRYITAKIFYMLRKRFEDEEEDGDDNSDDESGDDGSQQTEFDNFENGEEEVSSEEQAEMEEIASNINKKIEEAKEEKAKAEADLNAKLSLKGCDKVEIVFRDVLEATENYDDDRLNTNLNKKFLSIGNAVRAAREPKGFKGILHDTGMKITKTKLHRLMIDGNIFEKKTRKKLQRGNPEVIILLDISGSTFGTHVNEFTGEREVLLKTIVDASMGAFASFMNAKIPCAVYAHTTGGWHDDSSHIFSVASFQMPLNNMLRLTTTINWKERFEKVKDCEHNCNADGTALDFVSGRFSTKDGTKTILVLSDGRPTLAPDGFVNKSEHLDDEEEYVRVVAGQCRKKNIDVISLSLVENVVSRNDSIYGDKFNLRAYGGRLNKELQKLVSIIGMK